MSSLPQTRNPAGLDTTPPAKRSRLDVRREGMRDGVRVLFGVLAIMWIVQIVNSLDSYRLDSHGIVPRSLSGLQGIAFSPFLHASWGHLLSNTIPFVVLGVVIALEGPKLIAQVTLIVILVAGLGTWLTASSNSETVGASGVVFGYFTFLILRGFFTRRIGQLAIGAIVGLAFGLTLLYDLIPHGNVSWQDHLFGAIGGALAAWFVTTRAERKDKPAAPVPA